MARNYVVLARIKPGPGFKPIEIRFQDGAVFPYSVHFRRRQHDAFVHYSRAVAMAAELVERHAPA